MKKLQQGITLIEVMIAVGIFSLIGLAAARFARDAVAVNSMTQTRFAAEADSRKVLRPMVAEIRSASPSNIGSYPIEQAATSTMTFYSDVNDDSIKERIRYFIEEKKLKRGVITPTGSPLVYVQNSESVSVLIDNIIATTTPVFYYYDTNYTGTTSPLTYPLVISSIRLIKVQLTIDKNPGLPPGPVTVQGQVSIRNLKDNL